MNQLVQTLNFPPDLSKIILSYNLYYFLTNQPTGKSEIYHDEFDTDECDGTIETLTIWFEAKDNNIYLFWEYIDEHYDYDPPNSELLNFKDKLMIFPDDFIFEVLSEELAILGIWNDWMKK